MTRPGSSATVRLALTPRWLLAALVVVALVALAVLLGRWQWDRTQTILAAERAAASQPIPVEDVFVDADPSAPEVPDDGIGRPVTATGTYVPDLQVAVTDRLHEGAVGVWVVTGLELDDGTVVAVLRGSLPAADSPGADAPTTPVTVTGILQPDETFYADADVAEGTVASIAHDRLAQAWGATGAARLRRAAGAGADRRRPAPTPVLPTIQTADVPFPLQNFFYAFQWWIFGAFAIAFYLRWLWLEAHRSDEASSVAGSAGA